MIAHFVDSIGKNEKVKNHVCYNEQGAAFDAVGYAKTTRGISCAYSTSGPGATNLITGIADAYGINSYQVNNIDSFEKLLKDYDKSKPTLIEINLPVGTKAYPKTVFGSEMYNQFPYIPKDLFEEILKL